MEIIIKKDIFLHFNGTPPVPVPRYGVTLNWTNKVVLGERNDRGFILIYQKDAWESTDYKLILKFRPGMIKTVGRYPWSCQSLMTYIQTCNR